MKHLARMAKAIRIMTVAPLMALVMLLLLFLKDAKLYGNPLHFGLLILFLVAFPLLAYPLQPLIPKYKDLGREGQRTLAIFFAVAGYILGCLSAVLMHAPKSVWLIYLSYLLSGALVMLINKLFHFRASGHACGVTGPFAILVLFGEHVGFLGIPILVLVSFSSLLMKRHTIPQLICGTIIPFVALGLSFVLLRGV